jgi:TRAP-type uncharacterized transport system fused permease subunit
MTSVPCYLMLAVIVGPSLVKLGVLPIAAHLFFFYFGIVSFITPPVAVAAFVASGIAQSNPLSTGIWATRLGIVTFIVPFMFALNPALLLVGSTSKIIIASITAAIGVTLLAAAVEGFMFAGIRWSERIPLLAGSLLLIWPGWKTDIGGLLLALPALLGQLKAAKRISYLKIAELNESKKLKSQLMNPPKTH